MKTTRFFIIVFLIANYFMLSSCSSDDNTANEAEFVIAFKDSSENFTEDSSDHNIELVYSQQAPEDGHIEISFTTENLNYGEDFTTNPAASQTTLTLPVKQGTYGTSFVLNKLTDALPNEIKSVTFSISEIHVENNYAFTQGNTSTTVFYNPSAALGGTLKPGIGGPNETFQAYISLSSKQETLIQRDTWDLAFYSGDDFRVKLNGSIYMFVAKLDHTDIDKVSQEHIGNLKTEMDFLVPGSDVFVDNPNGDIEDTAIEVISANADENSVYLLKMGYKVGTQTPSPGGIAVAGEARGYKKIRILRQGDDYVLQYASLNDTSHQEIVLSKSDAYNFSFFSFDTENTVSVEPEKEDWDLNFTVKTETQELPEGGRSAYGFSDYVETNSLGNVKAYRVFNDTKDYENFTRTDIEENEFLLNQRVIGDSWRNVTPPNRQINTTIYYILKDANGNYYKIKFLSLLNENGVRGYPEFKYELLN